MVKLNLFIKTN